MTLSSCSSSIVATLASTQWKADAPTSADLGPEDFLRRYDFDYDAVLRQCPALAARLEPLTRSMNWLSTGPLRYGQAI